MLKSISNPLLKQAKGNSDISFDAKGLKSPHCHYGTVPDARQLRKLMRRETAAEAIGALYPQCAIFGITKGQFSLIELISVIIDQTGPAHLFVSTWTAAGADLTDADKLIKSGKLLDVKFLVDHTFQRRKPAFAAKIRELFGIGAVRVTRNHAKFCLIRNDTWNIVVRTSMNLNSNPRLEDFDILDDLGLAEFLQALVDEIFSRLKPKYLYDATGPNERRFEAL